jgi:predicted adenylyl cyclase CyaB
MKHINYEIKARCSKKKQDKIKEILKQNNALFAGTDNQIDTYFKIDRGRLKIRRGNIENSLVYYNRENRKNSKQSNVEMYNLPEDSNLEKLIRDKCDVLVVVDKKRDIYLIDNVKFHIDKVKYLGDFIEIEAKSDNDSISMGSIKKQCNYYKKLFKIQSKTLIKDSYSDMLLDKMESKK